MGKLVFERRAELFSDATIAGVVEQLNDYLNSIEKSSLANMRLGANFNIVTDVDDRGYHIVLLLERFMVED